MWCNRSACILSYHILGTDDVDQEDEGSGIIAWLSWKWFTLTCMAMEICRWEKRVPKHSHDHGGH